MKHFHMIEHKDLNPNILKKIAIIESVFLLVMTFIAIWDFLTNMIPGLFFLLLCFVFFMNILEMFSVADYLDQHPEDINEYERYITKKEEDKKKKEFYGTDKIDF